MSRTLSFFIFVCFVVSGCVTRKNAVLNKSASQPYAVSLDTLRLFDQSRNRNIPIAIYQPKLYTSNNSQQVVIFSHGYGQNQAGSYLAYSYLAVFLASKGFFVVSIQHELPTDSLMPATGIPQIARRPFWDRGVRNLLFVINELKKTYSQLDFNHITLIGHSNGADMTALFPQIYPHIVAKIITLDNRRMALYRSSQPKTYSLRSSDQPADEGVLPTEAEQKLFGIKIIKLPHTKHNDMDDHGSDHQHKEINGYLIKFMLDK